MRLIDHRAAQRGHDPVGEIAERVLAQQCDREDAEHFRAAREQHARQQRDCVVESPSMGTTRAHSGMTTARTIAVMPA